MTTNKSIFEEFTGSYSVQKTLRFALNPIGETAKHIKEKGLLQKDEALAEKYKHAKKIIDEYHKDFIGKRLSSFEFNLQDLEEYQKIYNSLQNGNKNAELEKKLKEIQKELRAQIANHLKSDDLFKKEFIKQTLPEWLETKQDNLNIEGITNPQQIINDFNNWTTYFIGFNENRKNIYTAQEHSTGIAYRVINENLPKFIDNLARFKKAKELGVTFDEVEQQINLDSIYSLRYFNKCLTQQGIDLYNLVKGGYSINKDNKQQGVNEIINLTSQQWQNKLANALDEEKEAIRKKIKNIRSCKLEELYKQILSDRESFSFRLEEIKNDSQLCQQISNNFYIKDNALFSIKNSTDIETGEIIQEEININTSIKEALQYISDAEAQEIYIKNNKSISDISQNIFGDWAVINNALEYYYHNALLTTDKKGNPKKLNAAEAKKQLKVSYLSFAKIHTALQFYMEQYDDNELDSAKDDNDKLGISKETKELAISEPLFTYFQSLTTPKIDIQQQEEKINLLNDIVQTYQQVEKILSEYKDCAEEKLKAKKEQTEHIKNYLDSIQNLLHFLKPLYVRLSPKEEKLTDILKKDSSFYEGFDQVYQVLEQIVPLYNQARNYLTKKAFSIEKYKLNFENSTLGAGWDKNKETDNTCLIFIKDGKYYLGVMNKKHNKLFTKLDDITGNGYQKMEYKLLPGVNKMLPKVFFSGRNIGYYAPSSEIQRIRNTASHTKNGTPKSNYSKADFNLSDCHTMIDFYKQSLQKHPEWKNFGFTFKDTKFYQTIDEFYKEVEHQGYKINFIEIKEDYINQCVKEGNLYLFEIYSKDFSPESTGNSNLQTLYWRELFTPENLKNVVYKLNGEIELFHRKPSIFYSDEVWKKGHHADNLNKKQSYPIIKDRRYAKDTFLFHVPITANFKAAGISRFNDKVNAFLQDNPNINIIGIDRGERHLAYYTLINWQGKIIKQETLNTIKHKRNDGEIATKDYHSKLDQVEKKRDKARKSWGTIEKIKDLKSGYLSQVVHKIVQMVVEHNAIVVFEDLNFGFKKGRFKVEKQIYQKLEKMLIDKLNYLVLKDFEPTAIGGRRQALQLTAPFKSFKDLGKQTGFIFYVPAYHTSKVCPASGFVNLLYPRYETTKKSQEWYKNFDAIQYDNKENLFAFSFDYKNFNKKAEGSKQKWIIYSYGTRLVNFRNPDKNSQWDTKEINLTQEFTKLFTEYNINYKTEQNLKEQIAQQTEAKFFKQLTWLLKLTLQLRNSYSGDDEARQKEDWMISPVKDKNGKFFDSRKSENTNMPENADANGAYHIALKGKMMLEQLAKADAPSKFKAKLDNKLWYEFVQKK